MANRGLATPYCNKNNTLSVSLENTKDSDVKSESSNAKLYTASKRDDSTKSLHSLNTHDLRLLSQAEVFEELMSVMRVSSSTHINQVSRSDFKRKSGVPFKPSKAFTKRKLFPTSPSISSSTNNLMVKDMQYTSLNTRMWPYMIVNRLPFSSTLDMRIGKFKLKHASPCCCFNSHRYNDICMENRLAYNTKIRESNDSSFITKLLVKTSCDIYYNIPSSVLAKNFTIKWIDIYCQMFGDLVLTIDKFIFEAKARFKMINSFFIKYYQFDINLYNKEKTFLQNIKQQHQQVFSNTTIGINTLPNIMNGIWVILNDLTPVIDAIEGLLSNEPIYFDQPTTPVLKNLFNTVYGTYDHDNSVLRPLTHIRDCLDVFFSQFFKEVFNYFDIGSYFPRFNRLRGSHVLCFTKVNPVLTYCVYSIFPTVKFLFPFLFFPKTLGPIIGSFVAAIMGGTEQLALDAYDKTGGFQIIFGCFEFYMYVQLGVNPFVRLVPLAMHCLMHRVKVENRVSIHTKYNLIAGLSAVIYTFAPSAFIFSVNKSLMMLLTTTPVIGAISYVYYKGYKSRENPIVKLANACISLASLYNGTGGVFALLSLYQSTNDLIQAQQLAKQQMVLAFDKVRDISVLPPRAQSLLLLVTDKRLRSVLIEVVFNIYHFKMAKTNNDYAVCIAELAYRLSILFPQYQENMQDELTDIINTVPQEPQSFDTIRNILQGVTGATRSTMYKTLQQIVTMMVLHTTSKMENPNYDLCLREQHNIVKYLHSKKYTRAYEDDWITFVVDLLNNLVDICENGYLLSTGSITFGQFLHTGNTYGAWYDEYIFITTNKDIVNQDPKNNAGHRQFIVRVQRFLEQGKLIMDRCSSANHKDKSYVHKLVLDVIDIQRKIIMKYQTAVTRMVPMGILIAGPPKCGKSFCIEIVKRVYQDIMDFTGQQMNGLIHLSNSADPYLTNWDNSKAILIMDDIASVDPGSGKEDNSLDRVLNAISPLPYFPNMASLEDKGTVSVNIDLAIATTNKKDLNSHHWFSNGAAFNRRFPYVIIPRVKKTCCQMNDSKFVNAIDENRVKRALEEFGPDYNIVLYDVEEVVLRSDTIMVADYRIIKTALTEKELYLFIRSVMQEHMDIQNNLTDKTLKFINEDKCKSCDVVRRFCVCEAHGGADTPIEEDEVVEYQEPIDPTVLRKLQRGKPKTSDVFAKYKMKPQSFTSITAARNYIMSLATTHRDYALQKAGLLTLATTVATMYGVYSAWKYFSKEEDYSQILDEHQMGDNNEWTPPEVTEAIQIPATHPQYSHLLMKTTNNLYKIDVGGRKVFALAIKGNMFLTVHHVVNQVVAPTPSKLIHCSTTSKIKLIDGCDFDLSPNQIKKIEGRDLCIIYIPNIKPARDLVDSFLDSEVGLSGSVAHRYGEDGIIGKKENISYTNNGVSYADDFYLFNKVGQDGYCGLPYIVKSTRGCVAGIHTVGSALHSGFAFITRQELKDAINSLEIKMDIISFSEQDLSVDSYGIYKGVKPLRYNANTKNLSGYGKHIGSIEGFNVSRSKGSVTDTSIAEDVDKIFKANNIATQEFYQPIMEHGFYNEEGERVGKDQGGVWRDPYIANIQEITKPKRGVPFDDAFEILESFKRYVDTLDIPPMQPLNDYQTVNGIPGNRFINRLDFSTSMGYPFFQPKNKFIYSDPTSTDSDGMKFDQCIYDEMEKIKECYKNNKRYMPIFKACLKDEPRPKRKMFKTRVFTAAPVAFNLLMRKYFLPVLAFIQKEWKTFKSAVGVNCRSDVWKEMFEFLNENENAIFGDYGAFDKNMSALEALIGYLMLIYVAKKAGYSDKDCKIMHGLAIDCCFPLLLVLGSLVLVNGSNPSGIPITVLINILVNQVYQCYVFKQFYEIDLFWHIAMLFYGDDNVITVPHQFPDYNHTNAQIILAQIGVIYTMADKTSESIPYISIEEGDFLKRSFLVKGNKVWAPLDLKSIYKSLRYRTKLADGVTDLKRDYDAIQNALIECVPHAYDNQLLFRDLQQLQKKMVVDNNLDWKVYTFRDVLEKYY